MRERSLLSLGLRGFHRLAYTEWGDPDCDQVILCVHGLTRTGRDFDFIAEALADAWRIACPDLPGRGQSHWLPVKSDYQPASYLPDMVALIARLDVDCVDWIGTSLGGMVGMLLAAQPNTPIRRLVLNDVGAFAPKAALQRIAGYIGADPLFADLGELEAYLRRVHAPFGVLSDAQWQHLARHSARHDEAGAGLRLHYDPGLAQPFKGSAEHDIDLWAVWDRITCPVLILRGALSDVLSSDVAEAMLERGPGGQLVEFPGIGHAPALMDPEQIGVVRDWLKGS